MLHRPAEATARLPSHQCSSTKQAQASTSEDLIGRSESQALGTQPACEVIVSRCEAKTLGTPPASAATGALLPQQVPIPQRSSDVLTSDWWQVHGPRLSICRHDAACMVADQGTHDAGAQLLASSLAVFQWTYIKQPKASRPVPLSSSGWLVVSFQVPAHRHCIANGGCDR